MFALCVFFLIGFGKLSAEHNLFLEFRGRTDKKRIDTLQNLQLRLILRANYSEVNFFSKYVSKT